MRIKSLAIKNFRCIKDGILDCENLTALVGRNGVGKSTFLAAINFFFDLSPEIDDEDFFNKDITQQIEIRIVFNNLKSQEMEDFEKFISGDELNVIKRISYDGRGQYFGIINQIPQFAEIRESRNKTELRRNFKSLCEDDGWDELDPAIRSADEAIDQMEAFEKNHPELTQPIECLYPFFGAKNVGGGKLDNHTKLVFIPAVHEVIDEVSGRGGAVQQLIDAIILKKLVNCKEMKKAEEKIQEEVKKLFRTDAFQAIKDLGGELSLILGNYAPGSSMELDWGDLDFPKVGFPSPKVTLIEDEFEGEIDRKGHGLQRALILSLLQYLAMVAHIEEVEVQSDNLETPDLIIAIEEPELYLHPSRSRYLSDLLVKLSIGEGKRSDTQILYSTHSPHFVGIKRFENIRMLRKCRMSNEAIPETIVTYYSLQKLIEDQSRIHETDPEVMEIGGFIARSLPIMNTIVSEGFFSDTVVVVEGLSEVGILWKLQEILGLEWERKGIHVIPAGSKNNIDRPVLIFRGLKIPTYFVFDGDANYRGRREEAQTVLSNGRLLLLAGQEKQDFPLTQINDSWAVFYENLEAEIKTSIPEEMFNNIRTEVASQLGYNQPSRVMKNIDGASQLINAIYEKGENCDILEELVRKIDSFHSENLGQ
ncbi:MAG: ATP-dependent endonuclease [Candidatus Hodarchaeota archaeon]